MGLYYLSVGRGCNLLLNIGPDRRGHLPDGDAERLLELGAAIRSRFGAPLATLADCRREGDVWVFEPDDPVIVDHAIIQERISLGEQVGEFEILCHPYPGGSPAVIHRGTSVGHKAICRFPPVRARRIDFVVTSRQEAVTLRELRYYRSGG